MKLLLLFYLLFVAQGTKTFYGPPQPFADSSFDYSQSEEFIPLQNPDPVIPPRRLLSLLTAPLLLRERLRSMIHGTQGISPFDAPPGPQLSLQFPFSSVSGSLPFPPDVGMGSRPTIISLITINHPSVQSNLPSSSPVQSNFPQSTSGSNFGTGNPSSSQGTAIPNSNREISNSKASGSNDNSDEMDALIRALFNENQQNENENKNEEVSDQLKATHVSESTTQPSNTSEKPSDRAGFVDLSAMRGK